MAIYNQGVFQMDVFTDSRLKSGAKVLFAILTRMDRGKGAFPRRETLAEMSGLSKGSVDLYIARLSRLGYVVIDTKNRSVDCPALILIPDNARIGSGFSPAEIEREPETLNHSSNTSSNYSSNNIYKVEGSKETLVKSGVKHTSHGGSSRIGDSKNRRGGKDVSPLNSKSRSHNTESQALLDDLTEAGMRTTEAWKLVAAHTPRRIRQALEYARARRDVINVPGFVIDGCRKDYSISRRYIKTGCGPRSSESGREEPPGAGASRSSGGAPAPTFAAALAEQWSFLGEFTAEDLIARGVEPETAQAVVGVRT